MTHPSPEHPFRGIRQHWQVASRTYPGSGVYSRPETVTEFEFGNGVSLHYNADKGELTVLLPVREAILSSGRSDETISAGQVRVDVSRIEGQVTSLRIVRAERPAGGDGDA